MFTTKEIIYGLVMILGHFMMGYTLWKKSRERLWNHSYLAWIPLLNWILLSKLVKKHALRSIQESFVELVAVIILVTQSASIVGIFVTYPDGINKLLLFLIVIEIILLFYMFYLYVKMHSTHRLFPMFISIVSAGIFIPFLMFRYIDHDELEVETKKT